jgi:hypothetical protein
MTNQTELQTRQCHIKSVILALAKATSRIKKTKRKVWSGSQTFLFVFFCFRLDLPAGGCIVAFVFSGFGEG